MLYMHFIGMYILDWVNWIPINERGVWYTPANNRQIATTMGMDKLGRPGLVLRLHHFM